MARIVWSIQSRRRPATTTAASTSASESASANTASVAGAPLPVAPTRAGSSRVGVPSLTLNALPRTVVDSSQLVLVEPVRRATGSARPLAPSARASASRGRANSRADGTHRPLGIVNSTFEPMLDESVPTIQPPAFWGLLLATTCLLQFAVALSIESRYEKNLLRLIFWVIWYPFFFWILTLATSIVGFPKAVLRRSGTRALWNSPDRGVTSSERR
jgi:hypothetical protein